MTTARRIVKTSTQVGARDMLKMALFGTHPTAKENKISMLFLDRYTKQKNSNNEWGRTYKMYIAILFKVKTKFTLQK
jgi:hypothetical protein